MRTVKLDIEDVFTGMVALIIAIKNHPEILSGIPDDPNGGDIIGFVVQAGLKYGNLQPLDEDEITDEVKDLMAKVK
jgi:hypothetical protein